jgi:protein-L-isoaspartate(D-aspartate) O-methyltransferase
MMNLENTQKARFNMIEQQVRPWNVSDPVVLGLMSSIKREDFVPAAHKALAFADLEIPLADGEAMLNPKVEARMVQDLHIQPTDKVLEIGTGSGFVTALLASRAQRVISMEISATQADAARANLSVAGITNDEVRCADGSKGAMADGPFDAIFLGGSVAEVPQNLLDSLKVGGRLIAVVGTEPIMTAHIVTRVNATEFTTTRPWDANIARLKGFDELSRFKF